MQWINQEFYSLTDQDQQRVHELIEGTGCEKLLLKENNMKILRTPDERFEGITDFPYEPHYTNIKTKDGSDLRIHHIDEGPRDGPILLAMHGQPVWCYLTQK